MKLRKTTDQIIEQYIIKQGYKYDYSKVEFKGFKEKVCIICPDHGEFWQRHIDHLSGKGCPSCAREYTVKVRPKLNLSQEEFLKRSYEKHGDKYNYDKVNYIDSMTKVIITCPIHGDFLQSPRHHYRSNGCFKCGRITTGDKNSRIILKDEFVRESKINQRFDYDYRLVPNSIKCLRTKVKIICKNHGIFEQRAEAHMRGHCCNMCCYRGYEREDYINHCKKFGYTTVILYHIRIYDDKESFNKIGITCKSVKERFRKLKGSTGYSYEIISQKVMTPEKAWDLEYYIKNRNLKYKYSPNKNFAGKSECFKINYKFL